MSDSHELWMLDDDSLFWKQTEKLWPGDTVTVLKSHLEIYIDEMKGCQKLRNELWEEIHRLNMQIRLKEREIDAMAEKLYPNPSAPKKA